MPVTAYDSAYHTRVLEYSGVLESHVHRHRKGNRGCQGPGRGGWPMGALVFNGDRVSVPQDGKSSGDGWGKWLPNCVNVLNSIQAKMVKFYIKCILPQ